MSPEYVKLIHVSVVAIFLFFIVFMFIILKEVKGIKKDIQKINLDNNKFREASLITERVENNSIKLLNTLPLPSVLRLACLKGIQEGSHFFKTVYIRNNWEETLLCERILNIYKSVKISNTAIEENFADELEEELKLNIKKIVDNILKWKHGNYNGKSFDKFIEMATDSIEMVLNIVYARYIKAGKDL